MAPLFKLKAIEMRSKYLFLILLLSVFCLSSCKKKQSPAEQLQEQEQEFIRQPEMELSANDTNQVNSLVNYYLECLHQKQVDKAMNMLYFVKGDSITRLPKNYYDTQKAALTRFAGYKYQVEYLKFLRETDCEVKYNVILFDRKPGDTRPNTLGFMLKPVRKSGKWYLTLADFDGNTIGSQLQH